MHELREESPYTIRESKTRKAASFAWCMNLKANESDNKAKEAPFAGYLTWKVFGADIKQCQEKLK